MWQTLKFLEWKSLSWATTPLKSDLSLSSAYCEGLRAYAHWQGDIFISLHNHFLSLWQGLKGLNNSPDDPALIPRQIEEAMQGVNGGDADLG